MSIFVLQQKTAPSATEKQEQSAPAAEESPKNESLDQSFTALVIDGPLGAACTKALNEAYAVESMFAMFPPRHLKEMNFRQTLPAEAASEHKQSEYVYAIDDERMNTDTASDAAENLEAVKDKFDTVTLCVESHSGQLSPSTVTVISKAKSLGCNVIYSREDLLAHIDARRRRE